MFYPHVEFGLPSQSPSLRASAKVAIETRETKSNNFMAKFLCLEIDFKRTDEIFVLRQNSYVFTVITTRHFSLHVSRYREKIDKFLIYFFFGLTRYVMFCCRVLIGQRCRKAGFLLVHSDWRKNLKNL